MSRDLSNAFEDDDELGGGLDLEKGSHGAVGSGVSSTYGGGGLDLDDDELDEGAGHASLELDLPGGGRAIPARKPTAGGAPAVPDLVLPGPPASSRSLPAPPAPSRSLPAPPAPSRSLPAPPAPSRRPQTEPSSGEAANLGPASGEGAEAPDPPGSAAAETQPIAAELLPARPTAAAIIAKYPPPPHQILGAPLYAVRVLLRQLDLRTDLESLRRRRSPDVPLYEAALRAYEPKTFRLGMAITCAALAVATFIFFLPVILRFTRD